MKTLEMETELLLPLDNRVYDSNSMGRNGARGDNCAVARVEKMKWMAQAMLDIK